ncbi:MAG: ATP-binding cassette domain-containing protein, partial [Abiotrophia defectiva]
MSLINVKGAGKTIKGRPILQDINFSIEAGECIALIGPNGAGKTTLIELLLHDKILSQGSITIKGMAVGNRKLKSTIGLLPQTNELPKNLKVKELISFFQSIYD